MQITDITEKYYTSSAEKTQNLKFCHFFVNQWYKTLQLLLVRQSEGVLYNTENYTRKLYEIILVAFDYI